MIFQPRLAQRILDGQKSLTRRLTTHRDGRDLRYKEGGVYAVQPGRGKPHVGHIRIKDIIIEPFHELGVDSIEARWEGFDSVADFEAAWAELHPNFDECSLVARIHFELADLCARCEVLA